MTAKTKLATSLLSAFACLLALPAFAADLGSVEIGDSSVTFAVETRASLDITGPEDFGFSDTLKSGEIYDFSIFRDESTLPDGTYSYELKALADAPKAAERDNLRGLGGQKTAERRVQSGSFTIAGGWLVDPTAVEPPARETPEKSIAVTQKLVHAEDVKIQGSLCVGVDCTSTENFGFDTVRLKENNLRIKFEDTSTGSFPSNDWQLTANDTSNGGANRFSIDDITGSKTPFTIEAGAPSNSLYIADTGEIGVGTSTPVSNVEIHVKDGDTPTLRLEQDGSSGFTAQTWDVAGNEANFFVRDVNHSSHLPFRIKPGSGNDNALYIDSDGDVGLGDTSPNASLHVVTGGSSLPSINSATGLLVQNTGAAGDGSIVSIVAGNSGNSQIFFGDTDSENAGRFLYSHGSDVMRFYTAGNEVVRIGSNGFVGFNTTSTTYPITVGTSGTDGNGAHLTAGGVWTNTSSREFKNSITDVTTEEALATLRKLNPVRYEYNLEPGEEYLGFIAEDVPDLVATNSHKYLNAMDIVAVLTKVVQKQQAQIDMLLSERTAGQDAAE